MYDVFAARELQHVALDEDVWEPTVTGTTGSQIQLFAHIPTLDAAENYASVTMRSAAGIVLPIIRSVGFALPFSGVPLSPDGATAFEFQITAVCESSTEEPLFLTPFIGRHLDGVLAQDLTGTPNLMSDYTYMPHEHYTALGSDSVIQSMSSKWGGVINPYKDPSAVENANPILLGLWIKNGSDQQTTCQTLRLSMSAYRYQTSTRVFRQS
jgi:hypothetical protein